MRRRITKVFKKQLSVLLVGILLAGFIPSVPVEAEEQQILKTELSNAVKQVFNQPLQASALAEQTFSWNVLNKVGKGETSNFYEQEKPPAKLSGDGRYAVAARYHGTPENPYEREILTIYDRLNGETHDIFGPSTILRGHIINFDLSDNAQYIVFSYGDWQSFDAHVYVYDREKGKLERITTAPSKDGFGRSIHQVSISANGRYVAFDSNAKGLVPDDKDDARDIFVYDRLAADNKVKRISMHPGISEDDHYSSKTPTISADGRYIAFQTVSKLVADDKNFDDDIYIYDRDNESAPYRRISVGLNGVQANGDSYQPSISADGQSVVFLSDAKNLVADDTNENEDLFVFDGTEIKIIPYLTNKTNPKEWRIDEPSISPDGKYVSYVSYEYENFKLDTVEAYVAEVESQTSTSVTVPNATYSLKSPKHLPVVSNGGNTVIFYSSYNDLGEWDDPELFIASSGSIPVWNLGSRLQGVEKPGIVTLTWPDATDSSGILGYRILKDGLIIGFVDASADNRFTVTNLNPGGSHLFQVEAVNTQYHVGSNILSYQMGTEIPEDPLSLSWDSDRLKHGLPMVGSTIRITSSARTGLQGQAVLTYKQTVDGVTESRTENLMVVESSNELGSYETTFKVTEGIKELTSLSIKLKDPVTNEEMEKSMTGWPIRINGSVTIEFINPGQTDLFGASLQVRSDRYGSEFIVLDGQDRVTLEGLYPDVDYTAFLYSSGHKQLLSEPVEIRVGAGQKLNVPMTVEAYSKVRFRMVDQDGIPVEDIFVQLFDSNQGYLGSYVSEQDGWTDFTEGLKEGGAVTAKVEIDKNKYQQVADQVVELVAGVNEEVIQLNAHPLGVLEGIVTNDDNEPIMNVFVSVKQTFEGRERVRYTYTNMEGYYKFDSMYVGDVSIEASQTANLYRTERNLEAKIEEGKTTTLPITVRQPNKNLIHVKVFLKYLDNDWIGPVNMEQNPIFVKIESGQFWQSGYYSNTYYHEGFPGEEIQVCATTSKPSYITLCETVTLDESSIGTAEFRFEELGGRIEGSLTAANHFGVFGNLYKLDGATETLKKRLGTGDFTGNKFNINIMEPGRYRLELDRRLRTDGNQYEYATVEFTVTDKQILQLGTIQFSSASYFANKPGNGFSALPNQAVPGSKVTFRVSYQIPEGRTATDTSLIVNIPEGMSPVKDSNGRITVNGIHHDAKIEGESLKISLGDLSPNQTGTVSYQLKVDMDFDSSYASSTARIKTILNGETIEESIGTILLDTPKVILQVPEKLVSLQTEISGFAPAGSPVEIYDGKTLVGGVIASPTGFWSTNVRLPDLGNPSTHALHAKAISNSVKLSSEMIYREYDTTKPKLLSMAMAQSPNKRWVTLEVDKGIARPPYTVTANDPFQFELKFDRPNDVENVSIYVGGQKGKSVKAVQDGNLFRAVIPTGSAALGGIYVTYDEKSKPFSFNHNQPTLQDIRDSMPLEMRDFEVVSTTPFELKDGKYSGEVRLKFPQLDDLIMSVKLNIEPNVSYQPTAGEIALAEQSGLPIFNSTINEIVTEESFTTIMEGYLPMDQVFPNGQPVNSNSARGLQNPLANSGMGALVHFSTEVTMEFTDTITNGNDIRKTFNDYKDFSSRINKLMYNLNSGFDCLNEVSTTVKEAGIALVAVVGGEIAKVGLGVWTGAMGLTGVGGLAAAYVTQIAEDKIDDYVDSKIDDVGSGYNECYEKPKRGLVAYPGWIYDPSGYVYEAVPENRLEGVKATVLYLNPDSNTWEVWDASPYEQINPHYTNDEGKYGWDVPPGKWKVVWEKEGYETQTSAELDVPPPHTEVNAGLISRAAPQVEKVSGVFSENGHFVDVTFTKYLQVIDLSNSTITVSDPNGKNVTGTSMFIETMQNPDSTGPLLSRTVRFEVSSDLLINQVYQIKVNNSYFKSYADVWMKEAYAGNFTAVEEDLNGPTPVEAAANGMLIRVRFNEELSSKMDLKKFLINGVPGKVTSAVTDVNENKLLYLTLSQQLSVDHPVEITLLAGAITDVKGNPSLEKNLTVINQSDSSNALLDSLTVKSTTLSPIFNPNQFSYVVQVSPEAKYVEITANTADSNSEMLIEGIESVSNAVKKVLIPASGEITILVKAEDATTKKTYTLQVNRQQIPGPVDPGPGPGPIVDPPPPPVGDPLDLGKNAVIEKVKEADGGTTVNITLTKETVVNALKSKEAETKPLFVELKEQANQYVLQLSKEIVEMLKKGNADVILKSDIIHVTIPTGSIDISSLSEGSIVRIKVSKASEMVKKTLFDSAILQTRGALKPLNNAILIGMEVQTGDQSSELKFDSENGLLIEWSVDAKNKEALYQYNTVSNKWTFIQLESSMNLLSSGVFAVMAYENTFGDVKNHWAKPEIEWMAQRLLVTGYTKDEFKPNQAITRGEFTVLLVRALGLTFEDNEKVNSFTDVGKNHVNYKAVEAAFAAGIVKGKGDGTFAPADPITREQMTMMITRAYVKLGLAEANSGDLALLEKLEDRERISAWAANDIALALQEGLVKGRTESLFDPKGLATRAHAVVMIIRVLQKK
jgi:large repetitive protein